MFCEVKGLKLTKANRATIMKGFMPTIKGRADGRFEDRTEGMALGTHGEWNGHTGVQVQSHLPTSGFLGLHRSRQ